MLLDELAQAEEKLRVDRRTAVAAEELVGSLELEVADITKQINLVQERARVARQKAAAETAAMRAAQISGSGAEANAEAPPPSPAAESETAAGGGGGSE